MEMTTQRSQQTIRPTIVTPMQTKWYKENKRKLRLPVVLWTMRIYMARSVGQLAQSFCFSIVWSLCVCALFYATPRHSWTSFSIHCYFIAAFYAACSFDISGYFFCLNRFFTFPSRHSDRWFISFVLFYVIVMCLACVHLCVWARVCSDALFNWCCISFGLNRL